MSAASSTVPKPLKKRSCIWLRSKAGAEAMIPPSMNGQSQEVFQGDVNAMSSTRDTITIATPTARRWGMPTEDSIILVLLGIALIFELLGWTIRGQSFLFNTQRLLIIILQVSIIGLLAIGVTQVIITGGIDLSSGSVVALSAMIAGSLAQSSDAGIRAIYPALTDLPAFIPIIAGLAVGALAGLINGSL